MSTRTETFPRTAPGTRPEWLDRLRAVNAAADAAGRPLPFGGAPKLTDKLETYASGATVRFTGVTGHGTVTLTWEEPDTADTYSNRCRVPSCRTSLAADERERGTCDGCHEETCEDGPENCRPCAAVAAAREKLAR